MKEDQFQLSYRVIWSIKKSICSPRSTIHSSDLNHVRHMFLNSQLDETGSKSTEEKWNIRLLKIMSSHSDVHASSYYRFSALHYPRKPTKHLHSLSLNIIYRLLKLDSEDKWLTLFTVRYTTIHRNTGDGGSWIHCYMMYSKQY